jgi:NAD-dependent DNA ligase
VATRLQQCAGMSTGELRDVVAWQLAHRLSLRVDLFLLSPDFRTHYKSAKALSDAVHLGPRQIAAGLTRSTQQEFASDVRIAMAAERIVLRHFAEAYQQRLIAHDEFVLVEQLGKRAVRAANRLIQSLEATAAAVRAPAKQRTPLRRRSSPISLD